MQRTIAPLVLAGMLSACSLANDLSELEGSAGADGGAADSGGSAGAAGGSSACDAACQRVALAGCANDSFPICLSECNQQPAAFPSMCLSAWTALLECMAQSGSFVCDEQGKADLLNCSAQQSAFDACRGVDAGGSGGSSGTAGSGGTGGTSGFGGSGGSGIGGFGGTGGTGGATCLASGANCVFASDCCSLDCTAGKCK